jgi:hypothetical protein
MELGSDTHEHRLAPTCRLLEQAPQAAFLPSHRAHEEATRGAEVDGASQLREHAAALSKQLGSASAQRLTPLQLVCASTLSWSAQASR